MSALARLKTTHNATTLRLLLRASGVVEVLDQPIDINQAHRFIKASTLDTVMLLDRRHVMLVDDLGDDKRLPVNEEATRLYLDRCLPGTLHKIVGDVLVLPDSDFARGGL